MAKRNGQQAVASADLRAKQADLARQMADQQARLERFDPISEWGKVAEVSATIAALERAIGIIEQQITSADAAEQEAASSALAAYTEERRIAAITEARSAAKVIVDQVLHMTPASLAALDAAMQELAAAEAFVPPEVRVVFAARSDLARLLYALRTIKPAWVDMPQPVALAEREIAEAESRLKRARARLDFVRQSPSFDLRDLRIAEAALTVKQLESDLRRLRGEPPATVNLADVPALVRQSAPLATKKNISEIEAEFRKVSLTL